MGDVEEDAALGKSGGDGIPDFRLPGAGSQYDERHQIARIQHETDSRLDLHAGRRQHAGPEQDGSQFLYTPFSRLRRPTLSPGGFEAEITPQYFRAICTRENQDEDGDG